MSRRRRALRRLLGAALGLLMALLLAETALRVLGVVREVGRPFSTWDAEDGARLRPSLQATRRTPDFTMHLSTNREGWRGPEPGPAPRGTVLFLGDSYTMGYGVDDGEEFVALVAAGLPEGVEARNFGIGGTGNGRWLRLLDREIPRTNVRVVVMQFTANDLQDNLVEGLWRIGPAGELDYHAPRPLGAGNRLMRWALEYVPGFGDSHLAGMFRQLSFTRNRPSQPPAGAPDPHPGLELTMRIVDAALARCRAAGIPVVGVGVELDAAQQRSLSTRFGELGFPLVVSPNHDEAPGLFFANDFHWNRDGHRWVAARIGEALQAQPCAARLAPPGNR